VVLFHSLATQLAISVLRATLGGQTSSIQSNLFDILPSVIDPSCDNAKYPEIGYELAASSACASLVTGSALCVRSESCQRSSKSVLVSRVIRCLERRC
jgi:hypothetical protein